MDMTYYFTISINGIDYLVGFMTNSMNGICSKIKLFYNSHWCLLKVPFLKMDIT